MAPAAGKVLWTWGGVRLAVTVTLDTRVDGSAAAKGEGRQG